MPIQRRFGEVNITFLNVTLGRIRVMFNGYSK